MVVVRRQKDSVEDIPFTSVDHVEKPFGLEGHSTRGPRRRCERRRGVPVIRVLKTYLDPRTGNPKPF